MKLIREMAAREMVHRFAIGEINSEFPVGLPESVRAEVKRLLLSDDLADQDRGMALIRHVRGPILNALPQATQWYLGVLTVNAATYACIRTMQCEGWTSLTNGSHRMLDAIEAIRANPARDRRVRSIGDAYVRGDVELRGITLVCDSLDGPIDVVEGHGRLISAYTCNERRELGAGHAVELEVAVGLRPRHQQAVSEA